MRWMTAMLAAGILAASNPAQAEVVFASVPDITAAPTGPTVVVPQANDPGGSVYLQFNLAAPAFVTGFEITLLDNFGTTSAPGGLGSLAFAILTDNSGQPGSMAPGTVSGTFGPGISPFFFATDTSVGTTIVHLPAIDDVFGSSRYLLPAGSYWLNLAAFNGGLAVPTFTSGTGDILLRTARLQPLTSPDGVGGLRVISQATAGVPEPEEWGLLIVGLGMVGVLMRRRRTGLRPA